MSLIESLEKRLTALEIKYDTIRAEKEVLTEKYARALDKLDFLAEKVEPLVRDYYLTRQPRTPRVITKPSYSNRHKKGTHGYYIIQALYEAWPEGLDETNLRNEVRTHRSGGVNNSAFSRAINECISNGSLKRDEDNIYHYI
jgi:hypothetical protein